MVQPETDCNLSHFWSIVLRICDSFNGSMVLQDLNCKTAIVVTDDMKKDRSCI